MLFLTILEFLNLANSKFTKIQSSGSKIAKNVIFGPFEFTKIWFYVLRKIGVAETWSNFNKVKPQIHILKVSGA